MSSVCVYMTNDQILHIRVIQLKSGSSVSGAPRPCFLSFPSYAVEAMVFMSGCSSFHDCMYCHQLLAKTACAAITGQDNRMVKSDEYKT